MSATPNTDSYVGCLLGGAVGDALGAPVEFLNRAQIRERYGIAGITELEPAADGMALITDDTQMTLFTAEGLLRAWVRGCFKGITTHAGVTANAYLRWLHTQGEQAPLAHHLESGWLVQHPALHARRAPGNTCLCALRSMRQLGEAAFNSSKGCGGVMRVAPVGLFAHQLGWQVSPEKAFALGAELAGLTHGHPTGRYSAGVLAMLVLLLLDGAPLRAAVTATLPVLSTHTGHEETSAAIQLALTLADASLPPESAIGQLGQGWIAEEALAIALYCALKAGNFREGVVIAVNHDGDSDSTGAIAGNLLGLIHGVAGIPAPWLERLELREVIREIALDLARFRDWDIGEYSRDAALNEAIWGKYPGF
ncbi:ADP-ribosylglycohydrolase family protein [Tahibacter amnicola]|uniref:ADP-ribosylglycohydrolase family protein n=1 Tax=Tahibacter amnicola TaxID=2976241 RepID=A0ABY6BLV0_9GAMM|nr:ADP-ribosylglycohydrolase family protein [Tahibacter amnicola]UXI70423.1 ADP-ribosylglycohydrolase family protein [Tahibacter amnicola]